MELIRDTCKDENIAMLMVTHSMEVANQFDRVVQLEDVNRVIGDLRSVASAKGGDDK